MKPWPKTDGWPRTGKRRESWQLGFRDHEGRVRSRSFPTRELARAWSKAYLDAERFDRLKEFLEGSDAPEVMAADIPLGQMLLDWLATDANPESAGGLAPATWDSYRSVVSRHILGNAVQKFMKKTETWVEVQPAIEPLNVRDPSKGYAIGHLPITDFASADKLKPWLEGMRAAGVSQATETRAWKVLSSALAWAVDSPEWPIQTNGCAMMQRRRGSRRASARAGTGATPAKTRVGKRREDLAAWALSPIAVERIRLVMLNRVENRGELLARRDATAVSIQYGLAMRNQEIWPLTFADLAKTRARVRQVLSADTLNKGKTVGATSPARRPKVDAILAADLKDWRRVLLANGFTADPKDFILRGDLKEWGAPAGHMSGSQAHSWARKYFTPAVAKVAELWPEEHADIVGATPYSLRRGMISLRIRAGEDRQVIAQQCGTSVEMLERAYSFAIEDLEDDGPQPIEAERQRAREMALAK